MANKITSVLEIKVADAVKALQDTQKALGKTEISGKELADALSSAADAATSETAKIKAASEAMANALGADFVKAREEAGVSVDDIVMELNRLGASFESIETDADSLAASVRKMDTVTSTAGSSMKDLGDRGDQTRSVLANLVGNSAQDLGNLAGVGGTAGVAIGQLAEYAADGNISLGKLVKLVGPMAALGVGIAGVTAYMDAQKRKAEELARITEFLGNVQQQVAAGDFKAAGAAIAEEYTDTIAILERYGYSVGDLIYTLDGEGYAIRGVERDLRDLQARKEEMIASGDFSANDIAGIDKEIAALKDLIDTLNEDQAAAAAAAEQNERNNRAGAEAANVWESAAKSLNVWSTDLADADKAATSHDNKLRSLREQVEEYIATTNNIPDEEITEIRAALDTGNIPLIEKLLANLTRPRIINIGVAMSGLGTSRQVGKGPSGTTGSKSTTPSVSYNAGSMLSALADEVSGVSAGGGGGGGGGGASPAQAEVTTWDEAIARALQYGEITRQNAIDYYNQRLEQEEKYTDAYHQLWQARQSLLDQQAKEEADRIKAQQDAEKEAAAEAKRNAEEAQRAAEKAAQAQENLIINVYSNSLDPMAVARAVEQARRMGGLR